MPIVSLFQGNTHDGSTDVETVLRDAAASRVGQWQIITYDSTTPKCRAFICSVLAGTFGILTDRTVLFLYKAYKEYTRPLTFSSGIAAMVDNFDTKWIEREYPSKFVVFGWNSLHWSHAILVGAISTRLVWEVMSLRIVPTKVNFTEKEIARLLHHVQHGSRNETKMKICGGNMEMAAQGLWPTGSVDHVSMRVMGLHAMTRWSGGHVLFRWLGIRTFRTELRRLGATVEPEEGGGVAPVPSGARGGEPASAAPLAPSPVPPPPPPPGLTLVESNTQQVTEAKPERPPPEANTEGARQDEDLVYGRDFRTGVFGDKVVGRQVGPCLNPPNAYENTIANNTAGREERYEKKKKAYTGTDADKKKIKCFVLEACRGRSNHCIFSSHKIRIWIEINLHWEDIKSKKWAIKRMEESLERIRAECFPEFRFKTGIKIEQMAEGKAPRFLVADGDEGQLMALIIIACFEGLLFEWFEEKSIKHIDKRGAVERVIGQLSKAGATTIEGDGSAWDTTCNKEIRDMTENFVLYHIAEVLMNNGVCPDQWTAAHNDACAKKKLKLFMKDGVEKIRVSIDAIRRSGHRGTSCLNYFINLTLWYCSVFKDPIPFLDPKVRNGEDVTGKKRWFNGAFEGDDSAVASTPAIEQGSDIATEIEAFWDRQGFNMKIVYVTNMLTFAGVLLGCKDGIPTGRWIPDVRRCLAGGCYSYSALSKSPMVNVKQLIYSNAVARAAEYAGLLPRVSRKFVELAQSTGIKDSNDDEMSLRARGERGYRGSELLETIEEQNGNVTPEEEDAILTELGLEVSGSEWDRFTSHDWSGGWDDHEAFRATVPTSWQ
jgi:hypothetical protein